MEKKSVGFGGRGTILIIYQMIGYAVYTAFTNFPQNVFSQYYGGATVTTLMTLISTPISFVITYFIIAPNIGKIKSFKKVGLIMGVIAMIFCAAITLIPPTNRVLWCACFICVNITATYWGCSFTTYIIGNWFPRRKGTVMGIVTMSFPIVTGMCLSLFMTHFYSELGRTGSLTVAALIAFSPYFILAILGMLMCAFFITDYPEQCGCYRDNDKTFTAEMANAMLMKELEARKNSVWKRSKMWKCWHLYFNSLPSGLLLTCAMAFMVQIIPVLYSYGDQLQILAIPSFILMADGANAVLFGLAIFALFGSWFLGVLDTKYGTKTAVFITSWIMLAAGIIGMINHVICAVAACWLLGLFMGAASNFGLSGIVRYWRAEDFPSVMSGAPPVGTIISTPLPFLIAYIAKVSSYRYSFMLVAIIAVACIVMNRLFNPRKIAEYDRKLRIDAGLEPDDVLFDRLDREKRINAEKKAAKAARR